MSEKSKIYDFRRKFQVAALNLTSYEIMTKIYYFIRFKRRINLKHPYYFNEKVNWLKLNHYPKNQMIIDGADKYAVRNYVKNKGLSHILNDLYGVWTRWEDVNWNSLPDKLVLKCTHGAQYNIIAKDKSLIDKNKVGQKINNWLNEDFGKFNAEEHYSKIKPRIICEKYLSEEMIDYKFFCFNGEPKFFYVARGFDQLQDEKMEFFNLDGTKATFKNPKYDGFDEEIKLPNNLNEMIKISKILSEDFPFVRVDLFEVNNKIYFSELTFTPTAGLMKLEPEEAYEMLGNYLDLSKFIV